MSSANIKNATIVNSIAKYSNVIIQLIINSILARLLEPEDFGIVAVITVFISFFNILADMGIGPAIIQNKELTKKNISDIFIFTFFSAIVLSVVFLIFSNFIAFFYNDSIYIKLSKLLSLSVFFSVLNIVPNAIILKNKQFKVLGINTVGVNVIVGIITIILAYNGKGYYSLIFNSILVNLLLFTLNFIKAKIALYWRFNIKSIGIIKDYSMYQFGFNFINYFSRNLDNILIGKFIGQGALGYYDKAYKLMLYPLQNLTFVITPVLHPILSDYQDDKKIIYEYFVKVVKVLSLLGVYVSIICFFCSREIVLILFGDNWEGSIPAFRILSVSIWVQIISSSSGSIFQAAGKTKELFKCGIMTTIVTVTCILISVITKDINYVAIGVVIAFYLNFCIVCMVLINKVLNESIIKFISNLYSNIIIAVIMSIFMIIIPIREENIFISIIIKGIIGTVAYILGIIVSGELKFVRKLILK